MHFVHKIDGGRFQCFREVVCIIGCSTQFLYITFSRDIDLKCVIVELFLVVQKTFERVAQCYKRRKKEAKKANLELRGNCVGTARRYFIYGILLIIGIKRLELKRRNINELTA